jgi:hypothetical protein
MSNQIARIPVRCQHRVAVAAPNGKKWGCIFCNVLDVAVQKDHRELQFTTDPSPASVCIRAGIAFAVGVWASFLMAREVVHLVMHAL